MAKAKLKFLDLNDRHPGVSPGVALNYAEAARVSLDRHHTSPCEIDLHDSGTAQVVDAEWTECDAALKAAWANKDDATRDGAYGLALAALEETRKLVAVRRAETRTGADYYLSETPVAPDGFEGTVRLEVSGTSDGSNSVINARLAQKLEQTKKGTSNLPAIASVVGFSARRIVSADLGQS
jgi:hypothetical protein